LRLRLACSAATLGNLASEGETGLRVGDQRGKAALTRNFFRCCDHVRLQLDL
jgi:hypothetical protein